MDFAELDTSDLAEAGVSVVLNHPATGEPLDATITVAGVDSKRFRKAKHEVDNRRLGTMVRRGKANLTAEQLDEESLAILVLCTLGWKNVSWDDKPLECTPENVRMLYTKLPWVREQVDRAMGDRERFLKQSASA